jgi:serine/threonine-protein kinase PpkA
MKLPAPTTTRAEAPAAVPAAPPPKPARPTPAIVPVIAPEVLEDYRAVVLFVIDSTISMRPYIEATKAAVRGFYDRIEAAGMLDQVAFGHV